MAKAAGHDSSAGAASGETVGEPPPSKIDVSGTAGQSRLIIESIQPTISEIRSEIREVVRKVDGNLILLASLLIGGVVLLAGMFMLGYLSLDAKIADLSVQLNGRIDTQNASLQSQISATHDTLIQINTQLQDLLQRIPPAVQSVPSK